MWSKQTEMLNKVTSTMVDGGGQGAGEQVNLNELVQADRNAEQGDEHHGGWRRPGRRRAGQPEWAGPADGANQGDVCEEAGDDEEDEQRHCPGPGAARQCLDRVPPIFYPAFHLPPREASKSK